MKWGAFVQFILSILDWQGKLPVPYGPYHIFCLVLTAVLTAVAIHYGRRHGEKQIRFVLLLTSLLVVGLEIYKQINFTFGDGSGTPSYQWYAFPFQFCSTPMYVGLLAALTRNDKLHKACCCYLATYSVFAGTCVMFYPNDVFVETVGINIQTMIWHGSMVVIGGYLLGSGYVKLECRSVIKAMPIFACAVAMAAVMNEIAHAAGIELFNMFFISPYEPSSLPVYNLVHDAVPFPVNLVIYVLGFTAAAFIVLYVCKSIRFFWTKIHIRKRLPVYR